MDLGAGNDTLTLANGGNTASVSNVETIIGGSGADAITLGAAAANASIDLGSGSDHLTFGNFSNTATIGNVETITGGSGNDTITLTTGLTTASAIDLGAGNNKLTFAAGGSTATVSNVDTLIGGAGADAVTLGTAITAGSADLGGGGDTLTLAAGTNSVSATNVATVFGGSGDDTIVLTGSNAALVVGGGGMNLITGNTGADEFVFNQASAGNATTVKNFSAAKGDLIALDTTASSTLTGNVYDIGSTGLVDGTDLASVADHSALIATTLSNGGKGAFVYEADTGGLYYSANGAFAGGGTLIGTITTNGTTPWTYDATKFVQV